ncbi:MAG: hypothetical protein M1833_007337 [Piccolia ochrophora]|nr:MAG: hypothetical protein M1833_007337 [Piccolia ochrophora]
MAHDPADTWLKIRDAETGKIVSAANWKVYPSYVEAPKPEIHATWWEEGSKEREMAETVMEDFFERRRKNCKEAHVLLFILFTVPEFQRRDAGSMMLKWGTDLADHLFLPMWVEASEHGYHLYESHGFQSKEKVHVQTEKWLVEYTHMRRPAKEPRVKIGGTR